MLSCKERKTRLSQLHTRIQTEWQTYYMNFVKIFKDNDNIIPNISENVDLDFDYVTAHPEYNWNYDVLAKNPNMPLDFIIKNVKKFITGQPFMVLLNSPFTNIANWPYIFENNINLTNEFLIDLYTNYNIKLDIRTLMKRGFLTKKEYLSRIIKDEDEDGYEYKSSTYYQLLLHDYTFAEAFEIYAEYEKTDDDYLDDAKNAICERHDFDFTYLDKYDAHWFNWSILINHPKIKFNILSKHIQNSPYVKEEINDVDSVFNLSIHPDITIEFIRNNRDLQWDWNELTKRICPQIIKNNMDLPWTLGELCDNIKLTPEFVLENKFFHWSHRSLIKRFYMHQEYVNYYTNTYDAYDIKCVLNLNIQQLDSIYKIKNTSNTISYWYEPFLINHWKHKFFTEEYRKHIAAYLIQQRWITVYMSPYNPIGEKRLCREYEKYQREHAQEHAPELPQVKN